MKDYRVGYLYSLAPIHCGGEGDLGNILEIAREVHTEFPYVPGSSLRGCIRNEVARLCKESADRLFGKKLSDSEQMGVHQVWFGDARLLWMPMRTMSYQGQDIFTWVSCPALIRDHAIVTGVSCPTLPSTPCGDKAGDYVVADAKLSVQSFTEEVKSVLNLAGDWPNSLNSEIKQTWNQNRLIVPNCYFKIMMEHSLWTQVRNKIQDSEDGANQVGSAEVFWTDVCIPRDTFLYYAWGYRPLTNSDSEKITKDDCEKLHSVVNGLIQVGGQANIGRGWVQSWVSENPVNGSESSSQSLQETSHV